MHILHLDYDDLNNTFGPGGQARFTYELYKRLSKKNKITVLTGMYPDAKNITTDGIHYKRLGIGFLGSKVSILSYWLLIPFYVFFLQHNFDIIIECFTPPFSVSFVPFIARKRLIGIISFWGSRELSVKYNLPFWWIAEWGIRKYQNLVVFSEVMKNKIQSLHKNASVSIIPLGVDPKYFSIRKRKGEYALFIGRIDIYNKYLDILLLTWKILIDRGMYIRLIIAGCGKPSDEAKLSNLILKNNLAPYVHLIGYISGKTKETLYTNSLCILCPSRFETFGLVPLEALAFGKPVFCTDIEGFEWIPPECVVKSPSFSVSGFYKCISRLLTHQKFQRSLSKRGRKFARQFNWDSIAKKYEQLFIS